MSAPHIHLILNHFPVVGATAAAGLLTLAVLMRRDVLARAGLWALVVSAAVAVPVYLSGDAAEDVVEELGVAEAVIEAHEEAALLALVALLVLGAVSVSALWLYRRTRMPRKLVVGLWVLSLGAGLLVARAANRGGEIRHTEIRGELFGGATAPEAGAAADDREDRPGEAAPEEDDGRRDRDEDGDDGE